MGSSRAVLPIDLLKERWAPTGARGAVLRRTPLLGRERDLDALQRLLHGDGGGLVTLSGPGGVGKTRLALAVVERLRGHFPDGAVVVDLAPITDPNLVPQALAQALALHESADEPLVQRLLGYLGHKRLLLLLDNVEQIPDAAPLVAELVAGCPRIGVLVTSREPLHLFAEQTYAVAPLAVPASVQRASPDALNRYPAVALFCQRAATVRADFRLTPENAPAVAAICRRLDGLPLALELAASRIKVLTPQDLLTRLEWTHGQATLPLLTGGARDVPARQQSLWNTIAWSYDLLEAATQALFRRLAVFVGGFSLEAAEAVCWRSGSTPAERERPTSVPAIAVLNGLATLVEHNLLLRHDGADGETRFTLLETIREFGLAQLQASGETDDLRRRHAAYVLAQAEAAEPAVTSAAKPRWLRRFREDLDNVRAALGWTIAAQEVETGLRVVGALRLLWYFAGLALEGRRWGETLLALPGAERWTIGRAKAVHTAALMHYELGDNRQAYLLFRETVAIRKELGDRGRDLAYALINMGGTLHGGLAASLAACREGIAVLREVGDDWSLGSGFGTAVVALQALGEREQAQLILAEGERCARRAGDGQTLATISVHAGNLALEQGDGGGAQTRFEAALTLARELGDVSITVWSSLGVGFCALVARDRARARAAFAESLLLSRELGNTYYLSACLEGWAGIASLSGRPELAVRLCGAMATLRERLGLPVQGAYRLVYDRTLAAARADLGEAAYAAAWTAGQALSSEQAADEAQALADELAAAEKASVPSAKTPVPAGLTAREVEVLRLLSGGQSNPEIAATLVLSVKTVERHLANVYAKIGARNRVDASTYALQHRLL